MARIKVNLPAKFSFAVQIPIRITDLNYGAHLGNDALLSILHEARVQFLQHCGLVEFDPGTHSGFIMADVAVEYKGEGFHGDVLQIEMAATDLHPYGFDVVYWVKNQLDREIARAKTGMLRFDYTVRKLQHLTPEVLAHLQAMHQ
ncbi:acyl-CoA thioesterase [Hymenobacter jejuensis]|uniref:Thioesterase n=1 Tax=Hymenobacter jejuensis TaxID=2502781 RepID=A0A5B8A0Z7_9BACT|nr:thioesterase family protein [Hymenobacter jejuensis]QDA60396.1 thioesterase [Hymenobacter jejuensis]